MCYPRNLGTEDASLLLSGASEVLEECDSILSMLDQNWTNLGENLTGPAILSRSLMAGMTAALMGAPVGGGPARSHISRRAGEGPGGLHASLLLGC